jgi:hypothetical protein
MYLLLFVPCSGANINVPFHSAFGSSEHNKTFRSNFCLKLKEMFLLFHFLPGAKIYVPVRYQNKFKQKDLLLFIPHLPRANINVPFRSNFILEQREMFLFVLIFPGANKNVPFCSNFCLERKDLFQFDIKSNIKKRILCVFVSISLTLLISDGGSVSD